MEWYVVYNLGNVDQTIQNTVQAWVDEINRWTLKQIVSALTVCVYLLGMFMPSMAYAQSSSSSSTELTGGQILAMARALDSEVRDDDPAGWRTCKVFAQNVVSRAANGVRSLAPGYCDAYINEEGENDFGHEVPFWEMAAGDILQSNMTRQDQFNHCDSVTDSYFASGPDGIMHTAVVVNSIYNPTSSEVKVRVVDANNGDCYNENNAASPSDATGCIKEQDWSIINSNRNFLDNCPNSAPYLHVYRAGPKRFTGPVVKQLVEICKDDRVVRDDNNTPIGCLQTVDECAEDGIQAGDTLHHFVTFDNAIRPLHVRVDAYQENENWDLNHNMSLDWSYTDSWQTNPRLVPTANGRAMFHFAFENVRAHDRLKQVGARSDDSTLWNFYIFVKSEGDADFSAKPKAHASYKVYRNPNPPGYVVNSPSLHYPNPTVCHTPPTADSRWFYRCQGSETTQFSVGQTVHLSARVDAVQRNHRVRYDVYKDNIFLATKSGFTGWVNPSQITAGYNLWDYAFHQINLTGLTMGQYRVFMFVNTDIANAMTIETITTPADQASADMVASFAVGSSLSLASANCLPEICGNGVDDDCDIMIDSADSDCQTPPLPTSTPGPSQTTAGSDSVAEGEWDYFTTAVESAEIERLTVTISDLSADIDLFVRYNALPNRIEVNCSSTLGGATTDRCEINDPAPGDWHIGVYGFEAGRYNLRIETTRRGYCAPGAWRCSDPFPTDCPPWGQRSRNCTLVNTGCLHPELVGQPDKVESCLPPPCRPAWAYRLGGARAAQTVEIGDLTCPSALTAWRYTTPLPNPRVGMACTEAGNCIVCTGGSSVTDVIIGCPNAQGEIPAWNQSPYHLPIAMSYHHAWSWHNLVCVMPSDRTLVYCAAWDAATKNLSEVFRLAQGFGYEGAREDKGLAVFGDNLCVAGGINLATTSPYALADGQCTSLYWDWNQTNLRPWTRLSSSLPLPRYAGNLTQAYGTMIWTGGVSNANATDMTGRMFLLSLNPSQTDSPWVEGPAFAPEVYNHTVFVHDNRVYLVGGYGPNGFVPNVHSAVFLGPTSLSPWEAAAPLHNGVGSTQIVVIEQPAAAVAPVAATAPGPDAGITPETVAVDAGTTVAASVTVPPTGPPPGFVLIPAGAFLLGSPESEAGRWGDEGPQIPVTITRNFWMKATEVTCNEWRSLMGSLPDPRVDPACTNEPANYVSFDQAIAYVNALSVQEELTQCFTGSLGNWAFAGLDCPSYRLPTEAEWEYAAKAGTTGPYHSEPIGSIAWYNGNSGNILHPVGQKAPNAWGLYDMIGNGHERTCSTYIESGYSGPRPIPAELCSTIIGMKSTRGGGFNWDARTSRASTRGGHQSDRPSGQSHVLRVVRTIR